MGLTPVELEAASAKDYDQLVDDLFRSSAAFIPLRVDHTTATRERYRAMKQPEQFKFRRANRVSVFKLNAQWRQRMIGTSALREKLHVRTVWQMRPRSWNVLEIDCARA